MRAGALGRSEKGALKPGVRHVQPWHRHRILCSRHGQGFLQGGRLQGAERVARLRQLVSCQRSCVPQACGKEIPYKLTDRRPGDVAVVFGSCALAEKDLNWKVRKTLHHYYGAVHSGIFSQQPNGLSFWFAGGAWPR